MSNARPIFLARISVVLAHEDVTGPDKQRLLREQMDAMFMPEDVVADTIDTLMLRSARHVAARIFKINDPGAGIISAACDLNKPSYRDIPLSSLSA